MVSCGAPGAPISAKAQPKEHIHSINKNYLLSVEPEIIVEFYE
jgi:hypothetical protein